MPELPEVETIRRLIEPQVTGRMIVSIDLPTSQIVAYPAPKLFSDSLTGKMISGMGRRGKFLWLKMENGDKVVFHLRMTGLPLVTPPDYPMDKHTHLILNFSGERSFDMSTSADSEGFGISMRMNRIPLRA